MDLNNFGKVMLQVDGYYVYVVDNVVIQYFGVNDVRMEIFIVKFVDGMMKSISFNIYGMNDVVMIMVLLSEDNVVMEVGDFVNVFVGDVYVGG